MEVTLARVFNGRNIRQRATDGYISATDMCKAFNRLFNDYNRLQSTERYLGALSSVTGLLEVRQGSDPELQGSYHYQR
jgi:hypothetical protein